MGIKFFLDDVPPVEFESVLVVLRDSEHYTKDDIVSRLDDRNLAHHTRFGTNTLGRMCDLGLLSRAERSYCLTSVGRTLKSVLSMDRNEFYEYIHYLHLQKAVEPGAREYFWTYWLLCSYIGERDGAWNSHEAASIAMANLQVKFKVDALAIDDGSLGKMLRWVRELSPNPAPERSKNIRWRDDAPVRPFLVALDFYYQMLGLQYGYPLLLTPEVRMGLRRVTFLSESGLDGLVSLGCRVFPGLRLHTSSAGLSIILDRPVQIDSLEAV